ncbi:MAG: nucleoside hydrolase [Terriglobia bacterium]
MQPVLRACLLALALAVAATPLAADGKHKIIIDQDARGPATTDLQAVLVLVQSPEVEPLGVTVVSGDQWRDEEVAHTIRLLEIIGRPDIPVVPGAIFPLINSREEIKRWEKLYGEVTYQGAWNEGKDLGYEGVWNRGIYYGPYEMPPLPEGEPTTKPADEHAANFIVRMVHKYPGEVTIYAGGPLTNLALAIALDPEVPKLAKELVVMGAAINPRWKQLEYVPTSRREFNFWWDPEAVHIVLRAPWRQITVTPVDISIKTHLSKAMIAEIGKSDSPAAQYMAKWSDEEYMWDELAAVAWLYPEIVRATESLYMGINIDHGVGYGDTVVWAEGTNPGLGEQEVTILKEVDIEKFYELFIELITSPTPEP